MGAKPRIRNREHLLRVTRWLLDEWGFEYTETDGRPYGLGGLIPAFNFVVTRVEDGTYHPYTLWEGCHRISRLLNDALPIDVLCQFHRGMLRFIRTEDRYGGNQDGFGEF